MELEVDCQERTEDLSDKPVLCDLSDFRPRKSGEATFPDESYIRTDSSENEDAKRYSTPKSGEVGPSKHLATDLSDESPISSSSLSTGFECTTLFDLDHVGDSTVTSNIYSEDGSERSSRQSDFQFPCESSTSFWKSLTSEGNFCHDSGFISYPGDLDYQTSSDFCSVSQTSDHQQASGDERSSQAYQHSAPLRIPEIHPPDQTSQWPSFESETNLHQESPLSFLSSFFPATDFSKEPTTTQIDFDTEFSFSSRDCVPPTEYFSKPHENGASYEPRQRTYEGRQFDYPPSSRPPDSVESSSTVFDVPEPWQQFTVNGISSQNRIATNRNIATPQWHGPEYEGRIPKKQTVPVCSSTVTSSMMEQYSEELQSVEATSTTRNDTSPPYLSQLSPVSDPCDVMPGSSDSSDSDTSLIDPTTTPPNPVIEQSSFQNSEYFQSNTYRDIPPLPQASFGNGEEKFSCSNVPTVSPFPTFPQSVPYNDCLPTPTNLLRPLAPPIQPIYSNANGPILHPGNIILSRPVQVWESMHRAQYQPVTYPTYPYINKYYDSSQNAHPIGPLGLDRGSTVPVEDVTEREHITLVPIPDDGANCTLPYTCPLEYYARNSGRFSAIQPMTAGAAHFQRCCEQTLRFSSRKRGAVSIKTKDGKFLCMASDFHTKTVRELLESAETCKASSSAKADSPEDCEGIQTSGEVSSEPQQESTEEQPAPHTTTTEELQPDVVTHEPGSSGQDFCVSSSAVNPRQTHSAQSPVDFSSIPNLACGQKCNEPNSSTEINDLPRPLTFPHPDHPPCPDILQEKSTAGNSSSTSDSVTCMLRVQPVMSRTLSTSDSQMFTTSVNVQPRCFSAQCTSQMNSVNHALGDAQGNSPVLQTAAPTSEFLYRGAAALSGSYAPQYPESTNPFQPQSDNVQHLMLHPGDVGDCYKPVLPPREVQLRTAQPYPLLHSTSHAQRFQLRSHPYLVPHANSCPSDYSLYPTVNTAVPAGKATHPGVGKVAGSGGTGTLGSSQTVQRWFIPHSQDKPASGTINTSCTLGR